MKPVKLMAAFPPPEQAQVTLANWRKAPFSQWGFRNVRELVPTSHVGRSDNAWPLPQDRRFLDDVTFPGLDAAPTTLRQALPALDTDGFIALHRGKIVAEHYDHGLQPASQHLVFSVTKSITGTLFGILAQAGALDADDAVIRTIPELKGSAYADCTLRHLLDMSVGIRFNEDYSLPDGDVARYRLATGWDVPDRGGLASPHLREYLTTLQPDGSAHGETFHYVSTNTDVLGWVFERVCAMKYADILHQYLWAPMGAEHDAYIAVDSRGAARAAGGFCASVRDLARFGEMMRNLGLSGGRQVVPSWWVDDIRRNGNAGAWARGKFAALFPNGNYRGKWYTLDRDRSAFCAIGIHGQSIYIDPEHETVIVRVSSQDLPFDPPKDLLWFRACNAIGMRLN